MHGHRLRHETNLRVRTHAVREIGVEDVVNNLPVVDGFAVGVLVINIGAAPFQCGRTITGAKQIVRAEKHVVRPQRTDFTNQLLAILHRGVIRLVRTEHAPDGLQFA